VEPAARADPGESGFLAVGADMGQDLLDLAVREGARLAQLRELLVYPCS
jgi:hypothetical protein